MTRILMFVVLCAATPLCAATLTVTNLNDTGAGSLRAQVTAATAGDEIVFDASLAGGTITFASVISPTVALTITGLRNADGKPGITLNGNDLVGFFTPSDNLTLNHLRLFDGNVSGSSGVVRTGSQLIVNNCMFESNVTGISGGAVFAEGANVVLTDCTFIDNVGGTGIAAGGLRLRDSSATIRRCTFANNTSGSAGAIMFVAVAVNTHFTMVIEDSTFSSNNTTDAFAPAGAISVFSNTSGSTTQSVLASRCTFSDNTRTGTGPRAACVSLGTSSTGATNSAQFAARECIFTDSAAGSMFHLDLSSAPGGFLSLGYNVCNEPAAWMTAAGDQVSTDPQLAALADNGGLTPTHAITAASPAYNAGIPSGGGFDQRGRPRDASPDVGAFELQREDLTVAEGASTVADGGTLLGLAVAQPGTAQSRTFTISNAATAEQDLTLTLPVTITGEVNCAAAVVMQPTATLPPGASSDLIAEATPVASGFFQYTVTITSSDPATPAFTFVVAGYAHKPGSKKGGDDDAACSPGTSQGYPLLLAALALVFAMRRSRHRAN